MSFSEWVEEFKQINVGYGVNVNMTALRTFWEAGEDAWDVILYYI